MRINPRLFDEDTTTQKEILEHFEHEDELSRRHCSYVHFISELFKSPDSYRSIDDPKYRQPTGNEIKEVFEHLASLHSKRVVCKMLGIKSKTNPTQTINRWINGESEIPYSAWRMLLILDGQVVQTNRLTSSDGSKPWEKFYE